MYDLIVIGGGPAGLAAAYAAWNKGLKHIANAPLATANSFLLF